MGQGLCGLYNPFCRGIGSPWSGCRCVRFSGTGNLYQRSGSYSVWSGDSVHYHRALFPLRYYGPYSGSSPGNGPFRCADDPFDYRNRRHQDPVDLCFFPSAQIPLLFIYFLSGFLDRYHCYAGGVLLLCTEAVYEADTPGLKIRSKVKCSMNFCS